MSTLPYQPDTAFDQLLQELPASLLALARPTGAFCRARKLTEPSQLLRLLLLFGGLNYPLKALAAHFSVHCQPITDQAIYRRLLKCQSWLDEALGLLLEPQPQLLARARHWRILLLDGTRVQAPGAKTTSFILHLCLNLVTGALAQLKLTDRYGAESCDHFQFQAGDLVVGDRAYCRVTTLLTALKQGAALLVRLNTGALRLRDALGQPLDLCQTLKRREVGPLLSLPVQLASKPGQVIEGYLHAYRLSETAHAQAQRRLRQDARHKHKQTRPQTFFFAGWLIIFTTASPRRLPAEVALELYRTRWQIEVAIKRCKSELQLGQLRARAEGELAGVWLRAKLLYILLVQRRAEQQYGAACLSLAAERCLSWWSIWRLVSEELATLLRGPLERARGKADLIRQALTERKRKRRLQSLPPLLKPQRQYRPSVAQRPAAEAA